MAEILIKEIRKTGNDVVAILNIEGTDEAVTTTFSSNVIDYVVTDRIDPIVIGLALFAMRNGYDFRSVLPISEELHYNLSSHFFDGLANGTKMHRPRIDAPKCQEIEFSGRHIATGISCGVDSLYTIETHTGRDITASHQLTDLVFLNVGSHKKSVSEQFSDKLYQGRRQLCLGYANEAGLGLIEITSNLPIILDKYDSGYSHVDNHTYMSVSAITWLQGYISRYYYSSGYPFSDFHLNGVDRRDFDSAFYDLLTLNFFSHKPIHFISSGGETSRVEKVARISANPVNCRYLNVCVSEAHNCGKCFKCTRTLLEIDAIGALDKYGEVFDIENYRKHRNWYLDQFAHSLAENDSYALELKPYLDREISAALKIKVRIRHFLSSIKRHILR